MAIEIFCDHEVSFNGAEQLNLYYFDAPADTNGGFFQYTGQLLMPGYGTGSAMISGFAGDFLTGATELRASFPYPCGVYAIVGAAALRFWFAFPISAVIPTDWEFRNGNDGAITPALFGAGLVDAVEKCYTSGPVTIANSLVDGFIVDIDGLDAMFPAAFTFDTITPASLDGMVKAYWGPDAVMEITKNDPDITITIKNTYNPVLTMNIYDATHPGPLLVAPFTETPC